MLTNNYIRLLYARLVFSRAELSLPRFQAATHAFRKAALCCTSQPPPAAANADLVICSMRLDLRPAQPPPPYGARGFASGETFCQTSHPHPRRYAKRVHLWFAIADPQASWDEPMNRSLIPNVHREYTLSGGGHGRFVEECIDPLVAVLCCSYVCHVTLD